LPSVKKFQVWDFRDKQLKKMVANKKTLNTFIKINFYKGNDYFLLVKIRGGGFLNIYSIIGTWISIIFTHITTKHTPTLNPTLNLRNAIIPPYINILIWKMKWIIW
jgi:hypothetical protein